MGTNRTNQTSSVAEENTYWSEVKYGTVLFYKMPEGIKVKKKPKHWFIVMNVFLALLFSDISAS